MTSFDTHTFVAGLPITALPSVGVAVKERLSQLGINRIFDLLLHLPRDYEDKSHTTAIGQIKNGMHCLVSGQVISINSTRGLSAIISDGTGQLELKFFKTYPALIAVMTVGQHLTAFGEVRISRFGVQMSHPDYHITGSQKTEMGLVPIYPSVKGIHQNKLRQLIRMALQVVAKEGLLSLGADELCLIDDGGHLYEGVSGISAGASQAQKMYSALLSALYAVHLPSENADILTQTRLLDELKARTHPACRRLILEELVAHQLSFLFRRNNLYQHKAPKCQANSPLSHRLTKNLPFSLTFAQSRVIGEIVSDMTTSCPMLRLVQGDVGAGKTLVAALSACHALDSGWQVAIMAPTEILAEQHHQNFCRWFTPLGVDVGFLVGKQSAKQRACELDKILNNERQLIVGTHALFQDGVVFAKLGLVVIDEQHRFGVEQRLKLADKGVKGSTPHQLNMTATPIPRTLAMSIYGDMDVSVIDELPPNRTPVTTVTISRDRRDEVLERVSVNCEQGKQAYWICPLVEESSALDAQSAELMYEEIDGRLPIKVGLVHGKMKATDKQAVMSDFKAGHIQLLVATTVIEVGVDVPNASMMVIENAERLGLSQLHQLRGRVGRGSEKSFCVLLYQTPLSQTGIERLNVLKDSTDGFVIAQKDLQLRGAGELLGKRQTGDMGYYIADIVRDEVLLTHARMIALYLVNTPSKKQLAESIMSLWLKESKDYVNA